MAIKAEKITGSLLLLDNLRKLEDISSVVNEYISKIEGLNRDIMPEIEAYLIHLESDISKLEQSLNQVKKELDYVNLLIAQHNSSIRKMNETMNNGRTDGKIYSIDDATNAYSKENPQYQKDLSQKAKLISKKTDLEEHIRLRNIFLNGLTKCKKRIKERLNAA